MLFHQNVSQTLFEEYQVVFVHPCPEEGSENMQFIVNVASPPPARSHVLWDICGSLNRYLWVLKYFSTHK